MRTEVPEMSVEYSINRPKAFTCGTVKEIKHVFNETGAISKMLLKVSCTEKEDE